MKSETESAPVVVIDPAILARGGADVLVRLFSGEQKTVLVQLLSLDQALTLLVLAEDYYGIADLVTGNEAGWARKTVAPDGVLEIAEKAMDLNFALARRLAELRAKHGKLAGVFKNPAAPSPA